MALRRSGSWDAECFQAASDLDDMIAGLGFGNDKIKELRSKMKKYIPPEVFKSWFTDKGGNVDEELLFALYAKDVLQEFCSSYDQSTSRRITFKSTGQGPMDFVQNVFMGYHPKDAEDEETLEGSEKGIIQLLRPNSQGVYNPTAGGKATTCPHCQVSFWTASAGNTNPEWSNLPEWRKDPREAPEHIIVNPSSGDVAHEGYHFCGGTHPIYLVHMIDETSNEETLDHALEEAEAAAAPIADQHGLPLNIRAVNRNGRTEFFLVDPYVTQVETALKQKKKLRDKSDFVKKFNETWIIENEDGTYERQCRYPIELPSPELTVKSRMRFFQPAFTTKEKTGTKQITVYKCPECPGRFRDVQGITSPKLDKARQVMIECPQCGTTYDITEKDKNGQYVVQRFQRNHTPYRESLDTPLNTSGDEETFTRADEYKVWDPQLVKIEDDELLGLLEDEVRKIGQRLRMRGSEFAVEIFHDACVERMGLKEITEKYMSRYYQLHYTECLDCGYIKVEKSNPTGDAKKRYDQGLPVNMTQCEQRHEHPAHQIALPVDMTSSTPSASMETEDDDFMGLMEDDTSGQFQQEERSETLRTQTEEEKARHITDPQERRKFLGLNLVFHGRSPDKSKELAISYLVTGPNMSKALPSSDPRAYKGNTRISNHIYAPANRLLCRILEGVRESPTFRKHKEEYQQMLRDMESGLVCTQSKEGVLRFCRA